MKKPWISAVILLAAAAIIFALLGDRKAPPTLISAPVLAQLRQIDVLNQPDVIRMACSLELEHSQREGTLRYLLAFPRREEIVARWQGAGIPINCKAARGFEWSPMSPLDWWIAAPERLSGVCRNLPATGKDAEHRIAVVVEATEVLVYGRRQCWLSETNYFDTLNAVAKAGNEVRTESLGRGQVLKLAPVKLVP